MPPDPSPRGLIDVHAHFAPDWYVEAAVSAGILVPDGTPGWPAWSVDEQLRMMDENCIERSVLSISSPGVHFGDDRAARELARRVNDYAAELCSSNPGRFDFFAALPLPAVADSLDEAGRALDELGAVGIGVLSNSGGRYLNYPGFEALWRELDARAAPVFVHPTSPADWPATALGLPRSMIEFLFDTTRTFVALALDGTLDSYPRIQFVVPHGGGALPALVDRIALFQRTMLTAGGYPSGSTADIETALSRLWYDTAGVPMPTSVPLLVSKFGDERLLFGSDYCFAPAALVSAQIASLDTQEKSSDGVTWRERTRSNALRLLGPEVP